MWLMLRSLSVVNLVQTWTEIAVSKEEAIPPKARWMRDKSIVWIELTGNVWAYWLLFHFQEKGKILRVWEHHSDWSMRWLDHVWVFCCRRDGWWWCHRGGTLHTNTEATYRPSVRKLHFGCSWGLLMENNLKNTSKLVTKLHRTAQFSELSPTEDL